MVLEISTKAMPDNLPAAQTMIHDLLDELAIAVNECCNDYWNNGHGERVEKKYGIKPTDGSDA